MTEAQTATRSRKRGERPEPFPGVRARRALLAGMPVTERTLDLAGITTSVLEAGAGPPVVLLHGPMGNATHWMQVIPGLSAAHRVIVPDLPGHGASEVAGSSGLDSHRVLKWLGELIARTCRRPPVLIGQTLGGAIAARFASEESRMLMGLVLVDTLGLRPFEPEPEFGRALSRFLAQPTERSHAEMWRHCAFDVDALRRRMGPRWQSFEAYNLDRAREPGVRDSAARVMELFGLPAIPANDLASISVPTTLIWGRHDRATPLAAAEDASRRFGWPLHVIEDCNDDPPVEQPEALDSALRFALDGA
jgi:pimeloyl-ACP methyl ester carboxylesterase